MKSPHAARKKAHIVANDKGGPHFYVQQQSGSTFVGFTEESAKIKYRSVLGMIFAFGLLAGLGGGFAFGLAAPYAAHLAGNMLQQKNEAAAVPTPQITASAAIVPAAVQQQIKLANIDTTEVQHNENAAQHKDVPDVAIKLPVNGDDLSLTPDVEATLQHALKDNLAGDKTPGDKPKIAKVVEPDATPTERATALAQSNDFEALEKLQKLVRLNPDNAAVEAALGRYLARHDDSAGSEEHFVQAIRLEPGNLEYRLNLATLYDHTGRYAQALSLYRRITHAAPDDVEESPLPFDAIRARSHYLAQMVEGE